MPRKNLTIDLAGSGVRFARINADQSASELTAADLRTALGVSPSTVTAVSATQDSTTTTYAAITGTSVALEASSSYLLETMVSWADPDEDGTPGFKMDFGGTAGISGAAGTLEKLNLPINTLTSIFFATGLPEVYSDSDSTGGFVKVSGILTTTTAGTLLLRFAQAASAPGVIIRTGLNTYLSVRKIR